MSLRRATSLKKKRVKMMEKEEPGTGYFLSWRANRQGEENPCSLTSRYSAFVNFQQDEDSRVYIYIRHFASSFSCNNLQFAPICNYTCILLNLLFNS